MDDILLSADLAYRPQLVESDQYGARVYVWHEAKGFWPFRKKGGWVLHAHWGTNEQIDRWRKKLPGGS